MDPNQLDRLAKLVGSGQSRRRILKTLGASALVSIGAAVGLGSADAAKLRSVGNSCTTNSDCASGLCVQESRTRKICHCRNAGDCPAGDQCHQVSCSSGACVRTVAANGTACDTGNKCTLSDTCQNGVCSVGLTAACEASDQCHDAGTCDPDTGQCSNPAKADGTSCDDDNSCTTGDVCTSGVCAGTAISCDDRNPCTTDSCDPETGDCIYNPLNVDDGNACTRDWCDAANGAIHHDPISCDDHNACTTDTCDAQTGCAHTAVANGTACAFTHFNQPATGACADGACSCIPSGGPCDCTNSPTVAGCCTGECNCTNIPNTCY